MFLFYELTFFRKGDIIQGRTLFLKKEIWYIKAKKKKNNFLDFTLKLHKYISFPRKLHTIFFYLKVTTAVKDHQGR